MTDNPILCRCLALVAEGWHPTAVHVSSEIAGEWRCAIQMQDMVPMGEGGDTPHHVVTVDRSKIPPGVQLLGIERIPDDITALRGSSEAIETWVAEVARDGHAIDAARGKSDGREWWLTKPNRWRK